LTELRIIAKPMRRAIVGCLFTGLLFTPLTVGSFMASPDAPPTVAELMARLDMLHPRRDDAAALDEAHRLVTTALALAPSAYGVLWRAARVRFTESDQPSRSVSERSRLGKEAYDLAERAIAVNPNDVAGHYWAALGIGSYAEGMGALRALANGIEGKFTRPLERATALDVTYDHGNVPVIWAAYHLELPWPKRDRAKAAQELDRALKINPANLRARLYQARLAVDEGRADEAARLLRAIAAADVGKYDPPEERRVQQEAAAMAKALR
jgi:tetratricopeptide (TPR) repeat protein